MVSGGSVLGGGSAGEVVGGPPTAVGGTDNTDTGTVPIVSGGSTTLTGTVPMVSGGSGVVVDADNPSSDELLVTAELGSLTDWVVTATGSTATVVSTIGIAAGVAGSKTGPLRLPPARATPDITMPMTTTDPTTKARIPARPLSPPPSASVVPESEFGRISVYFPPSSVVSG